MEQDLGGLKGKSIAIWGLAFKPGTDDVREAPALRLIELLLSHGATVRATDPEAHATAQARLTQLKIAHGVTIVDDPYEACHDADALVLVTEWSHFRSPDADKLKRAMRGRHVFDGRNVMTRDELTEAGLIYRGIGRS
jgi:UDPglucose 6-dehydrogenase